MFALRKKTLPWFPIETIERTSDGNPPASFADLLAFRLNFGRFKLWIADFAAQGLCKVCTRKWLKTIAENGVQKTTFSGQVHKALCVKLDLHTSKFMPIFFIFSKFIFLGWRCLLLWITLLGFLGRPYSVYSTMFHDNPVTSIFLVCPQRYSSPSWRPSKMRPEYNLSETLWRIIILKRADDLLFGHKGICRTRDNSSSIKILLERLLLMKNGQRLEFVFRWKVFRLPTLESAQGPLKSTA